MQQQENFVARPRALTAAAQVQRRLSGTDPRAWAELAEAHNRPLFEAVLDAAAVREGTRLLDVGCGSGLALVLAAERGAVPSGVDVSPGLLGIARERLLGADLREADMEALPFEDEAFDAVVGVNAFQFAGDVRRALREAARVLRPGGRLAIADIVSGKALKERTRRNVDLWAACIAGAVPRHSYIEAIEDQGMAVKAVRRNDYRFVSERAQSACSIYEVQSISLLAVKPG
jgi:arsenite methyltransferase